MLCYLLMTDISTKNHFSQYIMFLLESINKGSDKINTFRDHVIIPLHILTFWCCHLLYNSSILISIYIQPHSCSHFWMQLQLCNIFPCFPDFWKRDNSFVYVPESNNKDGFDIVIDVHVNFYVSSEKVFTTIVKLKTKICAKIGNWHNIDQNIKIIRQPDESQLGLQLSA